MESLSENLHAGVTLTVLDRIETGYGDVLRGLKASDPSFFGFGELYFTEIYPDALKGWKRHNRMVMNLMVLKGEVEFFIYDEDERSLNSITCRAQKHACLTVAAGLWVAFRGKDRDISMIANLASIEHDPSESDHINPTEFFVHV
jgi:dTDP-4-dehydrorhamnose 3,5-epimerase